MTTVRSLVFTPDGGQLIALGEQLDGLSGFVGKLAVYDVDTGEQLKQMLLPGRSRTGALSPDGRWFAATAEEDIDPFSNKSQGKTPILLWDASSWKQLPNLEGHTAAVPHLRFSSPDHLWSASRDGTIRQWTVAVAEEPSVLRFTARTVPEHTAAAFSADAAHFAMAPSGRKQEPLVFVWNPAESKEPHKVNYDGGFVDRIAISRDGGLLALGTRRANKRGFEIQVLNRATGEKLLSLEPQDQVTSLEFSPDGKLLLSGTSRCSALLWSVDIPSN